MNAKLSQANRLFISYAHADNRLFDDAVKSFADDLQGFYIAKTGNELSIFFDRESIGWGDDWRSRIDGELKNASIFMPVITMQYFNRPACRDELNAFNQSAKRLDAQYLILPVVIAGASAISADHPIPEVATIEALQFRNLEDPFLAGQGTPEWRRAISKLTDELITLIARAELAAPKLPAKAPDGVDNPDQDEDEGDLLTGFVELENLTPTLTQEAEKVMGDFKTWTDAVTNATKKIHPGLSAHQMQVISMSIASQVKDPSEKIHDSGVRFAETVEKADAVLNSISDLISQLPTLEQREAMERVVAPMRQSTDLNEALGSMTELLDSMASAEAMSAPLRKSLKPARIGITKMQDAVRVVNRWSKDS
ncbi:toll/interleukin-1 receptor domain-containing protein [Streptomyces hydrogenans]|uniref:toll/interleukin-1 receptor domain-containing protein n=1 Tax=Streptomyces hydrogenans TaxID=1873719 RepID=UPI0036E40B12